jgi:hypothetical protein
MPCFVSTGGTSQVDIPFVKWLCLTFRESSTRDEQSRSIDQPEWPMASNPDFFSHFAITSNETEPSASRSLQPQSAGISTPECSELVDGVRSTSSICHTNRAVASAGMDVHPKILRAHVHRWRNDELIAVLRGTQTLREVLEKALQLFVVPNGDMSR